MTLSYREQLKTKRFVGKSRGCSSRWSYHSQGAPGGDYITPGWGRLGLRGEPMADKYSGPYKVLERGNKAWKLQVGERVNVVSRD